MEETLLYFWEECPTLKLEKMHLQGLSGERHKGPLHHQILNFFEDEKVKGLMAKNSDWLEVSDPKDPPSQREDGMGLSPAPKQRHVQHAWSLNGSHTKLKPDGICRATQKLAN